MENAVVINSLSKKFNEVVALKDITVTLKKGTICGLLGRNGAGKSTLVRLLSGVMKPTSGNASLYGYSLNKHLKKVKAITGLLPEEYALYEKLTIKEYINFIGALYDLEENLVTERFSDYSSKLGITSLSDRLIETLSKGQKQKVAIMASLLHEPLVLFLDEPLANLDVQAQQIVREIILEYKRKDRIIIIATHLLSNVQAVCDSLLIIDKGEIKYSGSMDDFSGDAATLEIAYLNYLGTEV